MVCYVFYQYQLYNIYNAINYRCAKDVSMLFHNRPVKAAMGSVIVNGGVQLSGGKSLVNTKLATLHFGAE